MRFTVTLSQNGNQHFQTVAQSQEAAAERAYLYIYTALEADGALASDLAWKLRQAVADWEDDTPENATFHARNGYEVTITTRPRIKGKRTPFGIAPMLDPDFDRMFA